MYTDDESERNESDEEDEAPSRESEELDANNEENECDHERWVLTHKSLLTERAWDSISTQNYFSFQNDIQWYQTFQ